VKPTSTPVDLGDLCTFCWEPTGRGSGRWANRIPSATAIDLGYGLIHEEIIVEITGWLCADCQDCTQDD
jgi:hypothetical protein